MKKSREKKLFPLFMDLTEKKVIVFGAGTIATRRIRTLLSFVNEIQVVAPIASEEVLQLAKEKQIVYHEKCYEREDLYDADLVLAATDCMAVNEDIYSTCKCLGIMVNIASDQRKCDFHFPAIVEQNPVVIGINAGGKDHRLVKEVRKKIEGSLKCSKEEEE